MRALHSADIFCKVIDNFGDAGVCWRLARALSELGLKVTLWIDDVPRLHHLRPQIDVGASLQTLDGFSLRRWELKSDADSEVSVADSDTNSAVPSDTVYMPADLVIEAFGCRAPASYLQAMVSMAGANSAPVWINLEYLSAEVWVENSHGLPSPHPQLPLTQYFYFPGFSKATGGLLREATLDAQLAAFGRSERADFLSKLGVELTEGCLLVSLFCYPHAPVDALLAGMRSGPPVLCLVPQGVATGSAALPDEAGASLLEGRLRLQRIAFLEPDDYDRLLWSCDLNFVRGEDSAVRAQWAAQPFLWQLYAQEEGAHFIKLEAFFGRYCASLNDELAGLLVQAAHAWNGDPAAVLDWQALCHALPALKQHHLRWRAELASQTELAAGLLGFARKIG